MLWYVEQTVPDPSCTAVGHVTCPTITALMPQVYLPASTSAMSAGGNISGQDVTLNFGKGSGGSILNTGSITASNTLTVNTDALTNQANQVDIGQIWSKVKGGYVDTTGTTVQPGGFMSAANMDLNVQTLDQIGGALQKLNADGTVDQAGTQQVLAALQQQLGTNFTQTTISDNLHTDFVKDGGGLPTFVVAAIAIAASIVTAGAAAAALGVALADMSISMAMMVGAASAMAGSAAGQLAAGDGLNFGQMLEAGLTGALTAGAFSALGAGTQGLQQIGSKIANGTVTATEVGQALGTIAERGLVTAGIDTAVYGGSFGRAFENSVIADAGVVGASAIGTEFNGQNGNPDPSSPLYVASHAALGCAMSSASGTGCVGGAIGGAVSAGLNPVIDANGNIPPAALVAIETMVGGGIAGALGFNVQGAMTAAQNETLNNFCGHNSCGRTLAAAGAAVGGGVAATASVGLDAATGGLNVLATPAEVAGGATVGAIVGAALGSGLDSLADLGGAIFNSEDLPTDLVGEQDSKSGQRGNRNISGPLSPENGGTGDAKQDFDKLTGGKSSPAPADSNYPPGTLIGPNGVAYRPGKNGTGARIDIPANGSKPHETLHY